MTLYVVHIWSEIVSYVCVCLRLARQWQKFKATKHQVPSKFKRSLAWHTPRCMASRETCVIYILCVCARWRKTVRHPLDTGKMLVQRKIHKYPPTNNRFAFLSVCVCVAAGRKSSFRLQIHITRCATQYFNVHEHLWVMFLVMNGCVTLW